MASDKRGAETMNNYKDIAEAYKESCEQAEKIITKQTEQIGILQHEISLHKQLLLCQEKMLKVLKQQLEGVNDD